MQEQLISFETAKLAKEKGFILPCHYWYNFKGLLCGRFEREHHPANGNFPSYSAPTQSLLQKWLREIHGIHIAILPKMLPSNQVTYYSFKGKLKKNFENLYNTYEEALEVGLLEALKLIK